MKRLTIDILLASTLAIAPAAWAQENPGGADTNMKGNGRGSPPAGTTATPPSGREGQTVPTPDDPEQKGRTGYPPGTQSPPTDTDVLRRTGTPPDDPHAPMGKGVPRPPTADDASPPNAPTAGLNGDIEVIAKIHQANQKEIEMAGMALEKAQSPQVKSYARKLRADHQAADKKLVAYVERKKMDQGRLEPMATAGGATTASSDDAQRRLQAATGADFDTAFVTTMLAEHDKTIDLVKSARDSVTDRQLRSLLAAMVPRLEQHRKAAQDLASKPAKT
jgi:putative membrane protein